MKDKAAKRPMAMRRIGRDKCYTAGRSLRPPMGLPQSETLPKSEPGSLCQSSATKSALENGSQIDWERIEAGKTSSAGPRMRDIDGQSRLQANMHMHDRHGS